MGGLAQLDRAAKKYLKSRLGLKILFDFLIKKCYNIYRKLKNKKTLTAKLKSQMYALNF